MASEQRKGVIKLGQPTQVADLWVLLEPTSRPGRFHIRISGGPLAKQKHLTEPAELGNNKGTDNL